MSLFEALRASRASILEKPISTRRSTCGRRKRTQTVVIEVYEDLLVTSRGDAAPAPPPQESCPVAAAAWMEVSGPGAGAASGSVLCVSGTGTAWSTVAALTVHT